MYTQGRLYKEDILHLAKIKCFPEYAPSKFSKIMELNWLNSNMTFMKVGKLKIFIMTLLPHQMKMTRIYDLKKVYLFTELLLHLIFLKMIFGSKLSGSLKIKIHLDIMQKKL